VPALRRVKLFACVVGGSVAQESVVDSALLRSIFRPFKPAFLYTTCTLESISKQPSATHMTGGLGNRRRHFYE
jgi:hypothetical protein